jgi:hypothetical protein
MSEVDSYLDGIQALLELDLQRKDVTFAGENEDHFLRLQSLLRCSIEHCDAALTLAKQGKMLSALALCRTSLEHALMARYLDQAPKGSLLSEYAVDKHLADLCRMAEDAGSIQSSDELRKLIKYAQKEHDQVATSPNTVIEKFTQAQLLKHMYFLLSQSSHPITAYQQYIELDSTGAKRRIRRNALNQDMSSVTGFLFQILSIALLTDASLSSDKALEDAVFNIALDTFAINELALTFNQEPEATA